MADFTTKLVKAYLDEDKDAYVEFKEPTNKATVLLAEMRNGKQQGPDAIMRHLADRIVRTVNVTVDGEEPDVKDFLDWPAELVTFVITAYFKALNQEASPSDKDESEKND